MHDPGFETLKTGGHVEYIRQLYMNDESWKRVRKGFSDLAAITRQPLSIPLVIILFPIEWKNTADPYPLTDVHQKIMDETTRNGLDVFDLTNAMNIAHQLNSGRIYNDFLHPSIFGHRLYAASILKYLCETNRLPNSDEMKQNFGLLKDDPLLEKVLRE